MPPAPLRAVPPTGGLGAGRAPLLPSLPPCPALPRSLWHHWDLLPGLLHRPLQLPVTLGAETAVLHVQVSPRCSFRARPLLSCPPSPGAPHFARAPGQWNDPGIRQGPREQVRVGTCGARFSDLLPPHPQALFWVRPSGVTGLEWGSLTAWALVGRPGPQPAELCPCRGDEECEGEREAEVGGPAKPGGPRRPQRRGLLGSGCGPGGFWQELR